MGKGISITAFLKMNKKEFFWILISLIPVAVLAAALVVLLIGSLSGGIK